MPRQWIRKAKSFEEAEKFDNEYYQAESPGKRLDDIQFCREGINCCKGGAARAKE
jgi:hypothetical protein